MGVWRDWVQFHGDPWSAAANPALLKNRVPVPGHFDPWSLGWQKRQ